MPYGPGEDPFAEGAGPFVAAGPHARAVDAVLAALAAGDRQFRLVGAPGTGKSRVAAALARAYREPGRRVALCDAGAGRNLAAELVRLLGGGPARPADAWNRLADLARLARAQQQRWLLILDGLNSPDQDETCQRLARIDPRPGSALALLTVENGENDAPWAAWHDRATTIPLPALTRTEAAFYLASKLTAAGWNADHIAPDAVSRLHAAARGVPRALDRLARRTLAVSGPSAVTAGAVEALLASPNAPLWAA